MKTIPWGTSSHPRYNAINIICLVIKWMHIKQKHVVIHPSPAHSDAALHIEHFHLHIRDLSCLKLILSKLVGNC